jgi:hypothetical protein
MQGHPGVQLASHFVARSTVQTAIIMASGLGVDDARRTPKFKNAAWEVQLGALRTDLLDMKLFDLPVPTQQARFIKNFAKWQEKSIRTSPLHKLICTDSSLKLQVDLVLAPIDGAEALRLGISGSVSVAAAGIRDECFVNPRPDADAYFVVAIGGKRLDSATEALLDAKYGTFKINKAKKLDGFIGKEGFNLINDLMARHPEVPPVIAMMFEGPYASWSPPIDHWHRRRRLQGSAVAAALTAYIGKVPYAMFVSRPPQVMQAAIAARGLGGRLYAIPLTERKVLKPKSAKSKKPNPMAGVYVEPGIVLRESQFITEDKNAILCCTSISEVCAFERVRFGFDGTVVTDTLTISATGRTARRIETFPLSYANMRDPDGHEIQAKDLLRGFKNYLRNTKRTTLSKELAR